MSELHNHPHTDRLRGALNAAAADLALDPIDSSTIRTRAGVRRRRRMALGGGTAIVAVALVGAVVANRDNGDDTIEFAEPTETTQVDGSTTGTTPVTTPITTPPTLPPVESDDGGAFDAAEASTTSPVGEFASLLPWKDGFLRVGFQYEPQPLGPIPDEIAALFPEEVLALFPDGLPPTIQEATDTLSEAGLLDEVTAVLAEHPEASDAVYALDPPPPTLRAAFTTDGVEWRTLDLDLPIEAPGQFAVSGDRLVVWSSESWGEANDTSNDLTIAWTSDLVTWDSTTVPLGDEAPTPEHFQTESYVNSVAFIGDQWLARVERHRWVDYEALLPEDFRLELQSTDFGYGMSTDNDGVTFDVGRADGEPTLYEFTWADLGLDGNPEGVPGESESTSRLLLGAFGVGFEEVPSPASSEHAAVFASDDEFFLLSQGAMSSRDGRNWVDIAGLPTNQYFSSMSALRAGELFAGDGPEGSKAYFRADDGSVSPVDLPVLPGPYGLWSPTSSGAWVVDVSEYVGIEEPMVESRTVTVVYEGVELTMNDGPDGTAFSAVDAVTGELIGEGFIGPDEVGRVEFVDYDEATGTYAFVLRDEAGAELVRIPGDVLDAAYGEASGSTDFETSTEPADVAEEWYPDLWLIATANGTDWLTLDVEDPNPESGYWPTAAAVNGGSVLYQTPDGWSLVALPTGG